MQLCVCVCVCVCVCARACMRACVRVCVCVLTKVSLGTVQVRSRYVGRGAVQTSRAGQACDQCRQAEGVEKPGEISGRRANRGPIQLQVQSVPAGRGGELIFHTHIHEPSGIFHCFTNKK